MIPRSADVPDEARAQLAHLTLNIEVMHLAMRARCVNTCAGNITGGAFKRAFIRSFANCAISVVCIHIGRDK